MLHLCSKYPISLFELNRALTKAKSPEELRSSFPFFETNSRGKEFTFKLFIGMTHRFIATYKDLNRTDWKIAKERITSIFNVKTRKLLAVETSINRVFYDKFLKFVGLDKNRAYFSSSFKKPYYDQFVTTLQKNALPFIRNEQDKKNFLNNLTFLTSIALPPKERLEKMYAVAKCKTDEEKAYTLQIILNLLIVETEVIKKASAFIEEENKRLSFEGKKRIHSDRTLSLQNKEEVTFFEIPESVRDTEVLAFWLNLSQYLDLSVDRGVLYASMAPFEESLSIANREDCIGLKNRLNELLATIESKELRSMISFMLEELDFRLNKKLFEVSNNLYSYFDDCTGKNPISLFNEKWEPQLNNVSYFLNFIFILLKVKLKNEASGMIDDYERLCIIRDILKLTINAWQETQPHQRDLYKYGDEALAALIQKNKKDQTFRKYNKDLTELYFEQSSCPIRNYPSIEEVIPRLKPPLVEKEEPRLVLPSPKQPVKKRKAKTPKPWVPIPQEPELAEPITKKKSFPYAWDERVIRWMDHPFGQALPATVFPEYQGCSREHQKLMHLFHDLHPYVDLFLSLGINGTWKNRKTDSKRIVIPAEISFENRKHRGFISYAIDPRTDVCYHKFFTTKMDRDLIYQSVKKVFDENDFPELQKAVLTNRAARPKSSCENSSYRVDPVSGNVEIEDRTRGAVIKLFNTN